MGAASGITAAAQSLAYIATSPLVGAVVEHSHSYDGVVIVTAHTGCFEMLLRFYPRHGFRSFAIGRKLHDEGLDRIVRVLDGEALPVLRDRLAQRIGDAVDFHAACLSQREQRGRQFGVIGIEAVGQQVRFAPFELRGQFHA